MKRGCSFDGIVRPARLGVPASGYEFGMWIVFVVFGIVAVVVVLTMSAIGRKPEPTDPADQPPTEEAHGRMPRPGDDTVARRPDGTLMPGSEEYRNRDGKP